MNVNRLRFFALLALLLSSGCNSEHSNQAVQNLEDFEALTPILEGIARASSLSLYEGLPHQDAEREVLEKELATKETVRLHDFPFYKRPLSVAPTDVETLRQLSMASDSYELHLAPKSCGGFHPDYCLVWIDGEEKYELLLCFGCGDVSIYDARGALNFEISSSARSKFHELLDKYRSQRPIPYWLQ